MRTSPSDATPEGPRVVSRETGHRAPGTGHRAPGTGHRAPGTGHRAPGTGHRAPGTGHRAPNSNPSLRFHVKPNQSPTSHHIGPACRCASAQRSPDCHSPCLLPLAHQLHNGFNWLAYRCFFSPDPSRLIPARRADSALTTATAGQEHPRFVTLVARWRRPMPGQPRTNRSDIPSGA
jgi:hypothetical protein